MLPNKLGMNLNFTASGVDIPSQLRELRRYGFTKVRLNIIPYNISPVAVNSWHNYARLALDLGFERVISGFGAGSGLTSSNYNNYANGIQEQATWFQEQNDSRLEYQIGNEEELHHDTSITNNTLRSNLRTLATSVKSVYTAGPVTYASSIFVGDEINAWYSEGLGGFDRIGFNLYGSDATFRNSALLLVNRFGSRAYVSEWGTNTGYQDFQNEDLFTQAIVARKRVLASAGVSEVYYYNFMESGNRWGAKMYPITGYFRTMWPHLLGRRSWFIGNPNVPSIRTNISSRPATPMRPDTPNRLVLN